MAAANSTDELPTQDGYVAKKVSLEEMQKMDDSDAAMKKYKESLIGAGAKAKYPDDPRHLIVEEFSLLFNDHAPLVFNPSDPKLLQKPLRIKEGATYRIKIKFYAQHDVVLGLKYLNFVYKLGIRVDKTEETVGSFAPRSEPYEFTFEEETAPEGWLARGDYKAKTKLVDDDGQVHLDIEYALEIAKDY